MTHPADTVRGRAAGGAECDEPLSGVEEVRKKSQKRTIQMAHLGKYDRA